MMRKIIAAIVLVISLFVLGFSSYTLYSYFHSIHEAEKTVDDIKDMTKHEPVLYIDPKTGDLIEDVKEKVTETEFVNVYEDIYNQNPDFVGWLTIPGTNIDYPVVQTPDNRAGTLFCSADSDVLTPSMNIIIYGHHMKAGTMFAQLDGYMEEDFYKEHKYIQFNTCTRNATYEVIAAFPTDIYDGTYKYYGFINGTEEEFNEFIENTKGKTPYQTADVEYGDEFLTLSTCAYHTSGGRFVVVAKRVV